MAPETMSTEATSPGKAATALVATARTLRANSGDALDASELSRRYARQAFEAVRDDLVRQQLNAMPIGQLKETTEGRVRLGHVEAAGYKTVGSALAAGTLGLQRIQGVGPQTASQVIGAARQLRAALIDSVRVRFDTAGRDSLQTQLLGQLLGQDRVKGAIDPLRTPIESLAASLDAVINDVSGASSRLRLFFAGRRRKKEARDALQQLDQLMRSPGVQELQAQLRNALLVVAAPLPPPAELWADYERRPVAYNGWLIDVGGYEPDQERSRGFLPAEIAARVAEHPLDTDLLYASLRGYQAFGAKFALAQGKSIVGDEMGLGKTVEALAVMCHLHSAEGATHFLVVCPLSVLVNWTNEVRRHTKLVSNRLHGDDFQLAHRNWAQRGGVGVTTFEALRRVHPPGGASVSLLVVDEAHYAKNPAAERTKRVAAWSASVPRVLFLTGTPMENAVGEFRTLVGHLQPAVAARVRAVDGLAGAERFRREVAPVYLRRNQVDVLEELPPRIEHKEWIEMGDADSEAYRQAVAARNFMAMRRAAFAPGSAEGSAKLARLLEVVDEAGSNGRKVVVFSYFLSVLEACRRALGDRCVGVINGAVSGPARQVLVDEFTAWREPGVLVSQFEAGGQGLNIQAASVVVLTEPQWKPTIEDQAIARCHRMGQVRPVDVYRLLAVDSVDSRMLEILASKKALFDEYARVSDLKEQSADAVDVSDVNATRDAATRAEQERRIIELERRRLGLDGP